MLRTINHRLEKLRDRDHCIGQAYFMVLRSAPTIEGLKGVFRDKILPLLQEYFFGDWGKIGLVLGREFVRRRETAIVELADFDHDERDALNERITARCGSRLESSARRSSTRSPASMTPTGSAISGSVIAASRSAASSATCRSASSASKFCLSSIGTLAALTTPQSGTISSSRCCASPSG
jgi:hypothetical protein